MLTHPQVQRYSVEAGLRNIMVAENEIVLTYLLQLMAERGILDKLAFKGGTCLRKMFIGSGGRFSTDLDFTRVEEHDHTSFSCYARPESKSYKTEKNCLQYGLVITIERAIYKDIPIKIEINQCCSYLFGGNGSFP